MRRFLDDVENAAAKLRDAGEKAVENAAERIDELRPIVKETAGKAVDGAKSLFDRAGDGIERAMQEAREAIGQAIEGLSATDEIPDFQPGEAPEAPVKPLTPAEEIDLDVETQVAKIRAAQQAPGAFSDYIAKKYGKDKQ